MATPAPNVSRLLGRKLGHYRVTDMIGAGGMGEVYRARDEHLERDVAIKVLPPGALADEAARKRFRKEALALSRLNHPNIATIYDFDTHGGTDFLVMEYVGGISLADASVTGAMEEEELLHLASELAEGVAAAHASGIVHRDLKPGNLRMDTEGRLKILDFGLAKLLRATDTDLTASLTATTGAVGTLPYMAPEQLQGKTADARTDIYGIGAVLYELATGQLPFDAKVPTVLADRILHATPTPPGRLRQKISATLENIILKCLEKDPNARYQSVSDLLLDLRTIPGPRPEEGAPERPWQHIWIGVAAAIVGALVIAAVMIAVRWHDRPIAAERVPQIQSLAVLPLANLTHDPEQDYFADGMTEALITQLSRIRALKVISRTSVMRYKGVTKPLPEIARELGVDGIIEGSVLRAGDRVRITTQLIYAPNDSHVWANSYDRDLRDVLALQKEVADSIASQVRAAVSTDERRRMATIRMVEPEAYTLYLQGRYWWNKRNLEAMNKAADYYARASKVDPTYAPAYAALADTQMLLASYSPVGDAELAARSESNARRAIELDATLSEPHTVMSALLMGRNDWSEAEREIQRALELDPNSASAHHRYAGLLHILGREDAAFAEIRKAQQLDPLSMMIATVVGAHLRYQNRYAEAETQLQEILKMEPNFASAHGFLMAIYEETGRLSQAIDEQEKYLTFFGKQDAAVIRGDEAALRKALAERGSRGYFEKSIELLSDPMRRIVLYTDPARYYLLMGEKEKALASLAAEDCRTQIYPEELRSPVYEPIRMEPHFQQILLCKGLPP